MRPTLLNVTSVCQLLEPQSHPAPRLCYRAPSALATTVVPMKMPEAWLGEDSQRTFTDSRSKRSSPIALWGAVRALSGVPPKLVVVRMKEENGCTEWQAAWVTDFLIGFVSMCKGQESWSAYSDETQPDKCTAWARPLSTVVGSCLEHVESKQVTTRPTGERLWLWQSKARVRFADGGFLELPLFGESEDDEDDKLTQALLDAVNSAMTAPQRPV